MFPEREIREIKSHAKFCWFTVTWDIHLCFHFPALSSWFRVVEITVYNYIRLHLFWYTVDNHFYGQNVYSRACSVTPWCSMQWVLGRERKKDFWNSLREQSFITGRGGQAILTRDFKKTSTPPPPLVTLKKLRPPFPTHPKWWMEGPRSLYSFIIWWGVSPRRKFLKFTLKRCPQRRKNCNPTYSYDKKYFIPHS